MKINKKECCYKKEKYRINDNKKITISFLYNTSNINKAKNS